MNQTAYLLHTLYGYSITWYLKNSTDFAHIPISSITGQHSSMITTLNGSTDILHHHPISKTSRATTPTEYGTLINKTWWTRQHQHLRNHIRACGISYDGTLFIGTYSIQQDITCVIYHMFYMKQIYLKGTIMDTLTKCIIIIQSPNDKSQIIKLYYKCQCFWLRCLKLYIFCKWLSHIMHTTLNRGNTPWHPTVQHSSCLWPQVMKHISPFPIWYNYNIPEPWNKLSSPDDQ